MTAVNRLLAYIRRVETGFDDMRAYDCMYGHNKIEPRLTQMTLREAIDRGAQWTKQHGSSAAGAYQFMRATLLDLMRTYDLPETLPMTPDTQDYLATLLLRRRGLDDFLEGKIRVVDFARRLAQEWASLPVLEPCQGAHRYLQRGQSYYAGDGMNKALVPAMEFETFLHSLRQPEPEPQPEPVNFWTWLLSILRRLFS